MKEILTQVIQTPEQQHYLSKLLGYHYDIQYKPSKSNIVADALSRSPETPAAGLLVLSMPQFLFLDDLKRELATNLEFVELRDKFLANPQSFPGLAFSDGLLLRHGKIWISSTSTFKQLLMKEFHASVIGGHAGITKTLRRLAENFFWDDMKKNVQQYVAQCIVC